MTAMGVWVLMFAEQLILMILPALNFSIFSLCRPLKVHQESEELDISTFTVDRKTQNPEIQGLQNDKLIGIWELLSGHKQ